MAANQPKIMKKKLIDLLKNFSLVLTNSEIRLIRLLVTNPYHPFRKYSDDQFVGEQRSRHVKWIAIYWILSISWLLYTLYAGLNNQPNDKPRRPGQVVFDIVEKQSLLGPVLLFAAGLYHLVWNSSKLRYELNLYRGKYSFFIGDNLVYVGELYNIYVKLSCERASDSLGWYHLTICGYNIQPISVSTAPSNNVALMRYLGRLLASNLNLNYFDQNDVSMHHSVRHRRRRLHRDSESSLIKELMESEQSPHAPLHHVLQYDWRQTSKGKL